MRRLAVAACLVALVAACFPPTVSRDAIPAPRLIDPSGRYVVGCGFDGQVSAPEVCEHGRVVGVYLDDTTPDLAKWVPLAASRYRLVIVARATSQRGCPFPQPPVLCAQEWYVLRSGFPVSAWGRLPRAHAYIAQWSYHYPWHRPPTVKQRRWLWRLLKHQHPRLLLRY